ncbi:MAG: hypothetical protein ACF8LL_09475, partial [Phycisphaerales bacterium]
IGVTCAPPSGLLQPKADSEGTRAAVNVGFSFACLADLNGDGEVNFFDVSVFLSAYNFGCP